MSQNATPTQAQIDTLRGLVRCGLPLDAHQRDCLATLLDAVGVAAQAAADVDVAYARLLGSLAVPQ